MRITFLTHFPGRGGSTGLLLQLLEFFRARGHVTSVLAGRDSPDALIDRYEVFSPPASKSWRVRLQHYRAFVETTAPELIFYISGLEEADLLRFLPYVRVRHVFTLEQHEMLDVPFWLKQLSAHWEACTANTPDVLEEVRRYSDWSYQSWLAPYHVAPAFHTLPPPRAEGAGQGRPWQVCCIGRLDRYQKRTHWLPAVIEGCLRAGRNFLWHIYGSGPDETTLQSEVQRRKCGQIVCFHGWTSSDALAKKASRHDLFFSCSRFEGLPLAMVEAMFCGLACVVPDIVGGVRYFLRQGGGWLYGARTANDAVNALLLATGDEALVWRKKQEAHRVIHALYGPRIVERHLMNLESSMLTLRFNGRVANLRTAPVIRKVRLPTYLKRLLLKAHVPLPG